MSLLGVEGAAEEEMYYHFRRILAVMAFVHGGFGDSFQVLVEGAVPRTEPCEDGCLSSVH